MTEPNSTRIADASSAPLAIAAILGIGVLFLVAMDACGLSVGVCVDAVVHAIHLWLPLLSIVLAVLIGGGLIVASMAARKWEQS